ncbi:uncharacterized protein LOC119672569 [Teleopsis dalmanni]|uniref:uncharacterized protein LOC119672569 n=1 Tax=Teleopsis dalmanni TaxID=139649 RepID=UPI0018CE6965|nr:uncharacterized protein LOC119672569 [Teleopsis dalmanni]
MGSRDGCSPYAGAYPQRRPEPRINCTPGGGVRMPYYNGPCPRQGMYPQGSAGPMPQNDCFGDDDDGDDDEMDDDDEGGACALPDDICPLQNVRSSQPPPKNMTAEQEELRSYEAKVSQELIRDNYCPGTIQDTTNRQVDFNKKAFSLALKGDQIRRELPSPEPITLIEAFIRRYRYDKKMIFKEQIENVKDGSGAVVDEQMRLVDDYFKTQHNTELTRALKSFIKADKIYSISQSSADSKPFDLELYNGILQRENIEIKVYSGNTKPAEGGQ